MMKTDYFSGTLNRTVNGYLYTARHLELNSSMIGVEVTNRQHDVALPVVIGYLFDELKK